MGSGLNKPAAATKMSIYPLLNHVYEEVGSVEVEVNWGGPEGWMSKAKVDSIIHRTKGDGGKVTSFSIDDVVYEDPIRRVRESMEKNRSWMSEINGSLGKMERPSRFGDGYDANPEKLQLIMRIVFERAISEVRLGQTQVVPVPLYEALDGKDTDDYVARVEPSSQGGQKMAKLLIDRLLAALSQPGTTT